MGRLEECMSMGSLGRLAMVVRLRRCGFLLLCREFRAVFEFSLISYQSTISERAYGQ